MNNSLKTDSIWSLIAKFSIPAVVGLVVNAIYNIVDRFFIGKYVGEEALASLMIVFPVLMFIFALSVLVAMGGANLISINLGKGQKEDTGKYFTTMVMSNTIIAVVSSILMLLFIEPLCKTTRQSKRNINQGFKYRYRFFISCFCINSNAT